VASRIAPSLLAIVSAAALAQVPTEFEVASIRPNVTNDRIVTINVGPGGRFTARGYTLPLLIQRAYGVMGWNIAGGPEWMHTTRYDIVAKAVVPGNLLERQLRPMLQKLLAERFQLRFHEEFREQAGYALVVARGGPKVKSTPDGQDHQDTFRMNQAGVKAQGLSMEDFARYVAGKLGLVAVDKTGLKGFYDFKAEWTVDADLPGVDPKEEQRAAVFRALENQLGLKLVAQKINVRTLIIDHAERASEN
jgi:uncharacterized protein (TIGR03435 family)